MYIISSSLQYQKELEREKLVIVGDPSTYMKLPYSLAIISENVLETIDIDCRFVVDDPIYIIPP